MRLYIVFVVRGSSSVGDTKNDIILIIGSIDAIEVRVPCTVFHLSFSEFS